MIRIIKKVVVLSFLLLLIFSFSFGKELTDRDIQEIEYQAGTAYNKGVELYQQKSYNTAIDSFISSLNLYKQIDTEENPKKKIIRGLSKNLSVLYYYTKQYDKALEFFKTRKEYDKENYRIYLTMSKILQKQSRQDSALKVLIEYDELADNYKIKRKIASIYESQGDLNNAVIYYTEAFQLNDSKVDILEKIALLHHKNGNTTQAIKAYNNFIATNPPDYILRKVYKNLGIFYQRTGAISKAIQAFQNSVAIKADKKLYFNIGQLYYEQKNYPQAEKYLKQLQSIDPDNPEAHYYLGLVYTKQGKKTAAISQFNSIINHSRYGKLAQDQINYLKQNL